MRHGGAEEGRRSQTAAWEDVAKRAEAKIKGWCEERKNRCKECGEERVNTRDWARCGECTEGFHKKCIGLTERMALSGYVHQCVDCALTELKVIDSDARAAAAERHRKGMLAEQSRVQNATAGNYVSYLYGKGASLKRFAEEELYMSLEEVMPAERDKCVSVAVTAQWLVWMESQIDVVSIPNYLNALAFYHRDKGISDRTRWPTEDLRIKDRLEGLKRMHAGEGLKRGPKIPISIGLLGAMVEWWNARAEREPDSRVLCMKQKALLLVGFFGLLRGKELVNLKVGDLTFSEQGVKVRIRESKGMWSREGRHVKKGSWVMLARTTRSGFRLSETVAEYVVELRKLGREDGDWLFPKWDTTTKTLGKAAVHKQSVADVIRATLEHLQQEFPEELGMIDKKDFAGHSLRRGGLNHGRRCGNSRFMSKMHGRWLSDAIEAYEELQEDEMAAFTAVM